MKRGQSGLSLLMALNKPSGLSSHDVVNNVRRVLGERRVGHAGTLDPFAQGVLLVMAGPATRLDAFLSGHDKSYIATIVFGASTTTDDCTGEIVLEQSPQVNLYEASFARATLESITGRSMQLPPAYSAIKVGGRKACDEARRGNIINLEPRPVEIFSASLLEIGQVDESCVLLDEARPFDGLPFWKVEFHVSKGTYIRSLARDIGIKAGCPAHLGSLERTAIGSIDIEECVSLDSLQHDWSPACIDPVRALGKRVVFASEVQSKSVFCGRPLAFAECEILEMSHKSLACDCIPPFAKSGGPGGDGELFSIVSDNKLQAIYEYDAETDSLKPSCVFNVGVSRGILAP